MRGGLASTASPSSTPVVSLEAMALGGPCSTPHWQAAQSQVQRWEHNNSQMDQSKAASSLQVIPALPPPVNHLGRGVVNKHHVSPKQLAERHLGQ